jgi:hypothetical protein
MSDERKKPETEDQPVNPGRRRLLGMAMYVPPIVIGAISLQQAGCQPSGSCMPDGGCVPSGNGGGCPPTGGIKPSGAAPETADPDPETAQ